MDAVNYLFLIIHMAVWLVLFGLLVGISSYCILFFCRKIFTFQPGDRQLSTINNYPLSSINFPVTADEAVEDDNAEDILSQLRIDMEPKDHPNVTK